MLPIMRANDKQLRMQALVLLNWRRTAGLLPDYVAALAKVDVKRLKRAERGEVELSRQEYRAVKDVLFRLMVERARGVAQVVAEASRQEA